MCTHLLFSELYYDMYTELKSYSLYICLELVDHVYMHGDIPCTLIKGKGMNHLKCYKH